MSLLLKEKILILNNLKIIHPKILKLSLKKIIYEEKQEIFIKKVTAHLITIGIKDTLY